MTLLQSVHVFIAGSYVLLSVCLPSVMKNNPTISTRRMVNYWQELWELTCSIILVLCVPELTFLTNESSYSVIDQTTERVCAVGW